jgi:hypothetical protein
MNTVPATPRLLGGVVAESEPKRRRADGTERSVFLGVLSDELLVSVATFLGVRDLGRLARVSTRFASRCIRGGGGAPLTISAAVAKLAVGSRPQCERDRRPRLPSEPWVRVLAALLTGATWARHSASHYAVGEGGVRAEAGVHPDGRAVLATAGHAPMVVGGDHCAMEVYYAEIETQSILAGVMVGVGRPGLDVSRCQAWQTAEIWGLNSYDGRLWHAGKSAKWESGQDFGRSKLSGDRLGLLLDCRAGR